MENKICDTCGRVGTHCPQCGGRNFYLLLGQLTSAVVDGREIETRHYKCRKCGAFSTIDDVVVNCKAARSLTQSVVDRKVAQATEIIEKTPGMKEYLAEQRRKRGLEKS